jgi:AAA15 family ATPase/GTPase
MIQNVRISGYREFQNLTIEPHPRVKIMVGENESGKSERA